jgi:hypothetical protein
MALSWGVSGKAKGALYSSFVSEYLPSYGPKPKRHVLAGVDFTRLGTIDSSELHARVGMTREPVQHSRAEVRGRSQLVQSMTTDEVVE